MEYINIFLIMLTLLIPKIPYAQDLQWQNLSTKIKHAVVVISNRFIAKGTIIEIKRKSKDIHLITMKIKTTEQFYDFPNFGPEYENKRVEIFSEIGIPDSIKVGTEAALILRVSGDERGQHLFLVNLIENA